MAMLSAAPKAVDCPTSKKLVQSWHGGFQSGLTIAAGGALPLTPDDFLWGAYDMFDAILDHCPDRDGPFTVALDGYLTAFDTVEA
jgi:hypothetical protein